MTPSGSGPPVGPQRGGTPQRTIGEFVLEREIGRGGMGVVWLARQQSMGRRVALKVLPTFATLDEAAVSRFRREAEATGRLTHPGIVPVHAVGETDGVHWFAMEFIDGPPLSALLDLLAMRQASRLRASLVEEAQVADRYPSLREPAGGTGNAYVRSCARLAADLCSALAVAHREGVIHRDLKPSNILIHPAGRPVLVDFGLARDEQALGLTRSGDQIGTPAYMAPEQARGVRRIDSRVDVYGIGAVLYELLTLRPPFDGVTAAEITHRILVEEPQPIRRLNPNVPVDLAAIVHRCLAKEPDGRYPAIETVELDLRAFLAGRAVHAELPGVGARLHAALQRHRRSLWTMAATIVATTGIAILAGVVDDRGDVRNGRRMLDEAGRLLVEHLDVARARDLYERASALTKDPQGVLERRRADFRGAFERHYGTDPDGREALQRFATAFDDADRSALQALLDRLEGRGSIRLRSRSAELRLRELAVRLATADGLEAGWRTIEAGAPLPTGEYLLRATAADGAVAVSWTMVRRDEETLVDPQWLPVGTLPDGFVALPDPRTGATHAVAAAEVTRAEWREWLATIADPRVRAELVPLGWDGGAGRGDVAVRGLSFAQARAFARAHGAHLPLVREHWLAASGGLQGLRQPWGGPADPTLVAADPFHLQEPEPVRSRPGGASPLGVLHTLGNVAEIGAAGRDGTLAMAGGSFLDDPAGLRLFGESGTVPVTPLPDVTAQHPGAGMRLYRFVAPPDDAAAAAAAEERLAALRAEHAIVQVHDWRLRRDGRFDYRLEHSGRCGGEARGLELRIDTPGFLLCDGSLRVLDGHGGVLPARAAAASSGEACSVTTEVPARLRAGQGYRVRAVAELQPASGLLPARDAFVLRLPLSWRAGTAQVWRLALPADCSIDEVVPPPARWVEGGALVLSWEQAATDQVETAVVRFRLDGGLGAPSSRAAAVERAERFVAAWNARGAELERLLDGRFVHELWRGGREEAVAGAARDRLAIASVQDVVRIGAIETVELTVDWTMRARDGSTFELAAWPMAIRFRYDADEVRAVRLSPSTQPDQGRFEDRTYVYPALRVRLLPPPETAAGRAQDGACELQVRLQRGALHAVVTGHMAAPAATAESIRFRLTNGASIVRPGRLLSRQETQHGVEEEWLFEGEGAAQRERWVFVQRGRRHFLLRLSVDGPDAGAAARAFDEEAAQNWFADVLAALRIE